MRTVAAWVTQLSNGQIVWQRLDNGQVVIEIYGKDHYRILETHFNYDDWEEVVKVFALKENNVTTV